MDDRKSNVNTLILSYGRVMTICQFQRGLKNEKVKLEVDRSRTVLALFVQQVLGFPLPTTLLDMYSNSSTIHQETATSARLRGCLPLPWHGK